LKCCIDILILCTVRNDAKSYQISWILKLGDFWRKSTFSCNNLK
jgi:hypothetical protein